MIADTPARDLVVGDVVAFGLADAEVAEVAGPTGRGEWLVVTFVDSDRRAWRSRDLVPVVKQS